MSIVVGSVLLGMVRWSQRGHFVSIYGVKEEEPLDLSKKVECFQYHLLHSTFCPKTRFEQKNNATLTATSFGAKGFHLWHRLSNIETGPQRMIFLSRPKSHSSSYDMPMSSSSVCSAPRPAPPNSAVGAALTTRSNTVYPCTIDGDSF